MPVVRGAGGEDVDAGSPQGVLQPVEAGLAQPQHLAQEPGHDHEAVSSPTLGLSPDEVVAVVQGQQGAGARQPVIGQRGHRGRQLQVPGHRTVRG